MSPNRQQVIGSISDTSPPQESPDAAGQYMEAAVSPALAEPVTGVDVDSSAPAETQVCADAQTCRVGILHHEGNRAKEESPSGQGLHDDVDDGLVNSSQQEEVVASAREIVRLFQCRLCSLPFRDPVTLPCGKSICKECLPQTHARISITYPAQADRRQGLHCPFPECSKEHALGDCSIDVILNKATHHMKDGIEIGRAMAVQLQLSTYVVACDSWQVAGISTLKEDENYAAMLSGGKLIATWTMAAEGHLKFEGEVAYNNSLASSSDHRLVDSERVTLNGIRELARAEMDCQVCYGLFHDPLTTGCGHTFCRPCLHRILDHSTCCPICRRKLTINPLLNRGSCPSNESVTNIMETFWKDEMATRNETATAELAARDHDLDLPLFICTLSFPLMPTFLHIFEPRYRLMIRRVLEGNRLFGMVMPRQPQSSGDAQFHELGTLLRLVNVQFYPDGRSLIETIGLSRFRVLRHNYLDGYMVCKTERIDDISLEEEEAREAAEVTHDVFTYSHPSNDIGSERHAAAIASGSRVDHGGRHQGADPFPATQRRRIGLHNDVDTETMSTQSLMQFAMGFVSRMRARSVPWLTEHMLSIYGECPDDPAIFPWWLASILPVKPLEKYRLLGTSSVRDRLKICCAWIIEWETRTWSMSMSDCTIL